MVQFIDTPNPTTAAATMDDHVVHLVSKHQQTPVPDSVMKPSREPSFSTSTLDTEICSSTRSTGSSSTRMNSTKLRGNLTRRRQNCDPLELYEVTKILGTGSMGNVTKVKKKESAIGGSARKEVGQVADSPCFALPIVGGLFRTCLRGKGGSRHLLGASLRGSIHSASSFTRSSTSYGLTYAMKSIHLSRLADNSYVDELKNEVEILKSLDHPHVVRAIETFEHRNQIFVVMECCTGGDLYCRDPYTEEEAARIVSALLNAISYMHSLGIAHRDIKYENILFASEDQCAEIKLIDFGLSKFFGLNEQLTEGVGTIYTMAPEVLKQQYSSAADLWSIGVVAYMLLSSQMPFYGRTRIEIAERIINGKYDFKGKRWKKISNQAKCFVEDLLVVDPDDRITAEEALQSMWLNRRHSVTVRNPEEDEIIKANESMVKFGNYSKLRKLALMVVAHKSTSNEIGILRKVFQKYDTVGDGQLSYKEFKAAIGDVGFDEDECREVFDGIDLDGSGKIRYTEFLAATIESFSSISEERLAEAFDRLDSDDSGYISAANLSEILGDEVSEEEIQEIIKEADIVQDGRISYAEFLALWEDTHMTECEEFVKEITVDKNADDTRHSILTVSSETGEPDSVAARACFLDGKMLSERHHHPVLSA